MNRCLRLRHGARKTDRPHRGASEFSPSAVHRRALAKLGSFSAQAARRLAEHGRRFAGHVRLYVGLSTGFADRVICFAAHDRLVANRVTSFAKQANRFAWRSSLAAGRASRLAVTASSFANLSITHP